MALPLIRQREDDANVVDAAPTLYDRVAAEALRACRMVSSKIVAAGETTVFAAFVMETPRDDSDRAATSAPHPSTLHAVSFGFGTHSVGSGVAASAAARTAPSGTTATAADRSAAAATAALCLHDLHAEVLARRGLVAYLLEDARAALSSAAASVAFVVAPAASGPDAPASSLTLRPGVRFHLFVTQTPCGDASVFAGARHGARCFRQRGRLAAANAADAADDDDAKGRRRQQWTPVEAAAAAMPHEEVVLVPTGAAAAAAVAAEEGAGAGASCAAAIAVSGHCNGVDDDREGCARLKPGKGARSLSMSCTDKICKWAALGLQGAAAGTVLPRIDLASVVVLADRDRGAADTCGGGGVGEDDNEQRDPFGATAVARRLTRAIVTRSGVPSLRVAAVVSFPRPFPMTRDAQGNCSAAAAVGRRERLLLRGATSTAAAAAATSSSSSSSWLTRVLNGKDGAPQGSNAQSRARALSAATAATSGGAFSSDAAPTVETPFCRRGVMRGTLQLAALLHRLPQPASSSPLNTAATSATTSATMTTTTLTYDELKSSNTEYAMAKQRWAGDGAVAADWLHEPATAARQASIALRVPVASRPAIASGGRGNGAGDAAAIVRSGAASAAGCEALKMTLVVRRDLQMGAGKIAAQCAHAAVDAVEQAAGRRDLWAPWLRAWRDSGSAKIVLQVESAAALMETLESARRAGLPCAVVCDAGRTQVAAGSRTVVAVGPAPNSRVDAVTGKLSLHP